jgi:hypothetical protein
MPRWAGAVYRIHDAWTTRSGFWIISLLYTPHKYVPGYPRAFPVPGNYVAPEEVLQLLTDEEAALVLLDTAPRAGK